MSSPAIRPARPGEAAFLTELILASKRHWGYSEAHMKLWADELCLTEAYLEKNPVFVAENEAGAQGVCSLLYEDKAGDWGDTHTDPGWWLDNLFVLPAAMGTGLGAALYRHAMQTVRQLGADRFYLFSDPNAAGFYGRMGAVCLGEKPSGIPGRSLPVYIHTL